jgi:hypothetical protein
MSGDLLLLEQHRKFLRDCGVADDVAAECVYRSAIRKAEPEKLSIGRTQQLVPALIIPVRSVRVTVESFPLRLDNPGLDEQGRPRKYEQKAGRRMLAALQELNRQSILLLARGLRELETQVRELTGAVRAAAVARAA